MRTPSRFASLGRNTRGSSASLDQSVPLVVITGESNAGGLGLRSDAYYNERAARSAVQILNNTTLLWEDLVLGAPGTGNNIIGHLDVYGGLETVYLGTEVGIANSVEGGRWNVNQVYMVKAGQGGSTIAEWAIGDASTYWTKFVERVEAAIALLDGAGVNYRPVVLYTQGINDAVEGSPISASAWKTATIAHFAKIRGYLGQNVKIYMTNFTVPPFASGVDMYNSAMAEIAAADSLVQVIDTTSLTLADTVHWDAAGHLQLAERFVDKVNGQLGQLSTPTTTLAAGSYGSAQTMTVTGPTGATLRWTSDGTSPTSRSRVYTGPIPVGVSATIKVRAFKAGYQRSEELSRAYTITSTPEAFSTSDATAGSITLSNSNRTATGTASAWNTVRTNTAKSAGKKYIEFSGAGVSTNDFAFFGVATSGFTIGGQLGGGATSLGIGTGSISGSSITVVKTAARAPSIGKDTTVGIAIDFDAGKIWIAANGTWLESGDPAAGTDATATFTASTSLLPGVSLYGTGTLLTVRGSYVEQKYDPPSGFTAWI